MTNPADRWNDFQKRMQADQQKREHAKAEANGARPGFFTVPVEELLALNTPKGEL